MSATTATNRSTTSSPTEPIRPADDGFLTLPVAAVEHDTDASVVVTFDTSGVGDDVDLTFRHGQHLTVRRFFDHFDGDDGDAENAEPVEIRRSYSLCSPAPDGALRVAIRRVDDGVFSTFATTELEAGAVLDVLPPMGKFTHELQPGRCRRYALVAGGSGITPVFSIAATILAVEPDSTVDLLYINRTSRSTMLLDDLQDLRDRYLARFRINFLFTREEMASPLLSGRPDAGKVERLLAAGFVPTDADEVFMCGPAEMLDTFEAALTDAGVDGDHIHREIFTAPQQGQVRLKPREVTETSVVVAHGRARLHGRVSEFELYEGDTVLEAVERVRSDAPFSCRAGVCSTCQASMPAASVTMDTNHGLTDDEVDRGYVLTCQARPCEGVDALDVDYDV